MNKRIRYIVGELLGDLGGWLLIVTIVLACAFGVNYELQKTKVIPNAGYERYVTIDDGKTKYEGEAVIIAADETTTVIQLGDKVYVASTKNVVYE